MSQRLQTFCINQQQFADRAGIARQMLSAVINGWNCRPEIMGKIYVAE